MDEARYKLLMKMAILLSACWLGWSVYDAGLEPSVPGSRELEAGLRYLEDGLYPDAVVTFDEAYRLNPENPGALRGKAQALVQIAAGEAFESLKLKRSGSVQGSVELELSAQRHYREALSYYNEAILREQQRIPDDLQQRVLGVSYANRGIVKDRMGDHRGALADYELAMELEPEVREGPGLLTRFLRNQSERPPTVADRAEYIRLQLALPEEKRLLRVPEEDIRQRAYSMD